MTDIDATEEALAAGLLGIDASRRVGWAKAFERARHVESLEEQVAVLREDVKLLRKAYHRLFGFTVNLPGPKSDVYDAELHIHKETVHASFVADAYEKGRSEARRHQAIIEEWDEVDHERRRVALIAKRQAEQELIEEVLRKGHDPRFDIARDGQSYRCSCLCGAVEEEMANEKACVGWIWNHRVDVAWEGDKTSWRRHKRQRAKEAKDAVVATETHGLEKDSRDRGGYGDEVIIRRVVGEAPA